MQKKIWLLALVAAVLLLVGSAAWADSEFYVIAGGGGAVGTKITSVPYTINNPGFYFFSGNLSYSGSGNAITVSADDVTLDLMGFSLTNAGAKGSTKGICMSGRTNVEIRNGTLRGFDCGVDETDEINGNKHRVINVRATNNGNGISLGGKNHLIKNCSASNNSFEGLYADSGLITDSVANNNGAYGIVIKGPGSVLGNTACNNTSENFWLGNDVATSILVDHNSAFGLSPNYSNHATPTSGVVITASNSGTP